MMEAEGLNSLVVDMGRAGVRAQLGSVAVVKASSQRVEQNARRFAPGGSTTPHYPSSITHDVTIGPGWIAGEIGPDKDRTQGALGNIFEYGTGNSAPISHLGPALDIEGPDFEKAEADLAERSVFG